jgi:hypothetical protein
MSLARPTQLEVRWLINITEYCVGELLPLQLGIFFYF